MKGSRLLNNTGYVIFFFILNAIYSLGIVAFAWWELSNKKRNKSFCYLLISVGVFVPLLGGLMILVAVFLLKKYEKNFYPIEIERYSEVEYIRNNMVKNVAHAPGWSYVRLYSSGFAAEERHKALLSISHVMPHSANIIYKQLVSDDSEEIRICAFSMLESQLDYLNNQISLLSKKHAESPAAGEKAFVAKQIALLYWELVYRNLSDKEFQKILMERSRFYAEDALNTLTGDISLWSLLAKIHIANGDFELAKKNLLVAEIFGAPQSNILPYLAQLAYLKKDYDGVKSYLSLLTSKAYIFKIEAIIEYWCFL